MAFRTAFFRLRRSVARSLAGLALVLVGYVIAGWALTPQVNRVTPTLEAYLSDLLNTPVTIAALEGEWEGFHPSFTLRGLRIGNSFALDTVRVTPALMPSVTRHALIFSQFSVDGGEFSVVEENGRWALPAFAGIAGDEAVESVFATLADQLLRQDAIQLGALRINVQSGSLAESVVLDNALLISSDQRHELRGDLLLAGDGDTVRAGVQLDAAGLASGEPRASLYINHGTAELTPWLRPFLPEQAPPVEQLTLAGQWWWQWSEGELTQVQARLADGDLVVTPPGGASQQRLTSLAAEVRWYPAGRAEGARLQLRELTFLHNDVRWPESAHDIDWSEDALEVATDSLSAGALADLATPWLPALGRHDIRGVLTDSRIRLPLVDGPAWSELSYAGTLRQGNFSAAEGVPGFNSVAGQVMGTGSAGLFSFAPGSLDVDLRQWLPESVPMDIEAGQVAWRYGSGTGLKIASGPMVFDWVGQGLVQGRFAFSLPVGASSALVEPVYAMHLTGTSVNKTGLMAGLPNNLPRSVVSWMDASLSNLSAGGWQIVMPNVMADEARVRAGQVALRLDNLTVETDPDDSDGPDGLSWPSVRSLNGRVSIDASGLSARLESGEFGTLRPGRSAVHVPFNEDSTGVDIVTQVSALGSDVWSFLLGSPLRETLPEELTRWQAFGRVDANVDLWIPLNAGAASADVRMTLNDAALSMPAPDLTFRRINGPLRYTTTGGLYSRGLTTRFLGSDHQVRITSELRPDGSRRMVIPSSGDLNLAAVGSWLQIPWLRQQEAVRPYRGTVAVGPDAWQFDLESDLAGSLKNLPPGFDAPATERFPLRLQIAGSSTGDWQSQGRLGDRASWSVAGNESGPDSVALGLGVPHADRQPGTVDIRARLEELDLAGWWRWSRSMLDQYPGGDTAVNSGAWEQVSVRIGADETRWGGQTLQNLDVRLSGAPQSAWSGRITADRLAADLRVPAQVSVENAIELDLGFLTLGDPPPESPVAEPSARTRQPRPRTPYEPSNDLLANARAAWVPPIDIELASLTVNGRDFGAWSGDIRPAQDEASATPVVRVDALQGDLSGLGVSGTLQWTTPVGAPPETRLNLTLSAGDLGDVLAAYELTPVIRSQSAQSVLSLSWPGSPLAFDWARLSGSARTEARSGSLAEMEQLDAVRVIGLLNVTRVLRRLALDFSDVFSSGVSYDVVQGELLFNEGLVTVGDELILDGSGAKMFFDGSYDITEDQLDAEGVVIARVSNTAGLLALGAGFSPPIALMVLFGERVLEQEIERLFSVRTDISGSLYNPEVSTSRLFDNQIRGNDTTLEERIRELFGTN